MILGVCPAHSGRRFISALPETEDLQLFVFDIISWFFNEAIFYIKKIRIILIIRMTPKVYGALKSISIFINESTKKFLKITNIYESD